MSEGAASDWAEDLLRIVGRRLAVQAWRAPDPQSRGELSSVARRMQAAIEQYEQRRRAGVRAVDTDDLERLRRRGLARPNRRVGWARCAFLVQAGALSNEDALILDLLVDELISDVADLSAHGGPASPRDVAPRHGAGASHTHPVRSTEEAFS